MLSFPHAYARVRDAYGLKKSKRFVISYLRYWPWSARWIEHADALSQKHLCAGAPADLIRAKYLRGYHSLRLGARDRLAMLTGHYAALEHLFDGGTVAAALGGRGMCLGRLGGKDETVYILSLQRHMRYQFEGELTLMLTGLGHSDPLAAVTFNLADDGRSIRIAGMQGPAGGNAKQVIVAATRNLWGARPKSLVLDALYALAGVVGCNDIAAVATRNHPLNDINHRLVADNDGFWAEVASARTRQQDFVLPAQLPVRDVSEVPAKKRKDWLRRQALKATLTAQVAAELSSRLRVAPPIDAQADLLAAE